MAIARYHQCPACKRLMPSIQSRCDCGERFTGREPSFKGCPACGSLVGAGALWCDCGYLFIFRRFLDKQNVQEITPAQLDVAYERGRRDGAAEEKSLHARKGTRYYVELEDGGAVSMTEDQLEEYGRRCNSPRSAEQLERQKRQLLEYLHGKAGDHDA